MAAILVLLATAATAEEWFEAYLRGLQALRRRDGPAAALCFERAIELRPEPGRNLPAAGNRRIDYFPYVHLAQARLLIGEREGAEEALGRSAASGQEPPLERVRARALLDLIERRRPPPPSLPAPAAILEATPTPLPTPVPASLVVLSDPPGAAVYFDDEPLGSTDPASGRLVKSGVAPGPHRLRLSFPGRPEVTETVVVGPAGPTNLKLSLPARPPRRAPGLALAALAGVVALGLLWRWRRRPAAPEPTPVGTATRTPPRGLDEADTRALATKVSAGQDSFGPFRLVQQLGRGGMATVFKAVRGDEICALKRPLASLQEDPEFLERFLREAEIGRTLHHPNIVRIFERGEIDGVPYFTMELVAGETLQARLKSGGRLAPREAARVVSQVAEALDYAHLKGVVHRDLKPSNVMLLRDGNVKVMDYGIARARRFEGLTLTGAFLGTPDYVAPETAEGLGSDARSDLYSLGVMFYEVLTGQRPFVADSPFATLKKHCTEPPTPPRVITPSVPPELEAVVLRLLRKDPAERYPSAEELLIELRQYLNRAA